MSVVPSRLWRSRAAGLGCSCNVNFAQKPTRTHDLFARLLLLYLYMLHSAAEGDVFYVVFIPACAAPTDTGKRWLTSDAPKEDTPRRPRNLPASDAQGLFHAVQHAGLDHVLGHGDG